MAPGLQANLAVFAGVAHGVVDQVIEHAIQLRSVGMQSRERALDRDEQLDTLGLGLLGKPQPGRFQ
ncbi:hypothetical protein D3C84_780880 [compost metagenome]